MPEGTDAARLHAILERAADQLGDIAPAAMDLFYSRFPDARETFHTLGTAFGANLEGEMVERSLYCLMTWVDCPGEIEIVLMGSVPHHAQTLGVTPDLYAGLLSATAEIVAASIPQDRPEEASLWSRVAAELAQEIQRSGTVG